MRKKVFIILIVIGILVGFCGLAAPIVEKNIKYEQAIQRYEELFVSFEEDTNNVDEEKYEELSENFLEQFGYKDARKYFKMTLIAEAEYFYEIGDNIQAYQMLKKAGCSAKDNQIMSMLEEKYPYIAFCTASKWDVVKFGKYEQDGKLDNGYEDLEWIVLETRGTKKLLFSKACIEASPYNHEKGMTSWKDSYINTMLNVSLYREMFTADEQKMILLTDVDRTTNKKYGTSLEGSEAYLFLLSLEEIENYYGIDVDEENGGDSLASGREMLRPELTDYMVSRGAQSQCLGYWLRTSAIDYDGAVYVSLNGYIHYKGDGCVKYNLVRPAMWIDVVELGETCGVNFK